MEREGKRENFFIGTWRKGRAAWSVLSAHRFTTIAGTLVFFLIMSLVPFVFWLTLLFGGSKTLLLGNLIKNEFMQARNWPMGATLSIAMLVFTTVFIYIYKRVTGAKTLGGLK